MYSKTHKLFSLSDPVHLFSSSSVFTHNFLRNTPPHMQTYTHSVFPLSMPVTLLSTQLTCVGTDTHKYTYSVFPLICLRRFRCHALWHTYIHTQTVFFHSIRLRRFRRHNCHALWHTYIHIQTVFFLQYACDASVDTIDVRRDTDRTFMLLTDLVGLEGTLSTCLPSCSPILWRLDLAMPAPNFPFSPNKPGWKKKNHIFN